MIDFILAAVLGIVLLFIPNLPVSQIFKTLLIILDIMGIFVLLLRRWVL